MSFQVRTPTCLDSPRYGNETEASRRLQRAAGKRLNRELTKIMFQKAEAETLEEFPFAVFPADMGYG